MSCIQRTLLAAALLAVAAGAQSQGANQKPKLPTVVAKEVGDMAAMCRDAGGKPLESPQLLQVADLIGDRLPDDVIDQGVFNCEGAASLFSGSGGSQMAAYVGTPDGQAYRAFGSGSFGVMVEAAPQAGRPATLLVSVGGPLCGQRVTNSTPRSSYKHCWRPVQWNAVKRKMDFAPVSTVRFIQ